MRNDMVPARAIISIDKDLSVEERDVTPRIGGPDRFNRGHRLDFSYFRIERNRTNFIGVTIPGGISNGPVNEGAFVSTTFNQKVFKINYLFSFFNTEKAEFGFNRFNLNVEASNDDILGEIDSSYNGLLLYMTTWAGNTVAGSQLRRKNR